MAREVASIRYKNPGAMWGSARATKWGANPKPVSLNDGTGQGNNIAVFPTFEQGAAAQFDLWRAVYRNLTLAAAIKKWSGGNSHTAYVNQLAKKAGITPDTKITEELLAGPKGIALMRAQANWEAGKTYPDVDWKKAQDMVFRHAVGPKKLPVVEPHAIKNEETESIQNQLKSFGYFEIGNIDGLWGGKTAGVITTFLIDRHSKLRLVATDRTVPKAIQDEVHKATAEGFRRPVAPFRANATAQDIAPVSTAIRQSLWQKLGAKIATIFSAGSAAVVGVADVFPDVNEKVEPVRAAFASVPAPYWFAGVACIGLIYWWSSRKVVTATVDDHNIGKIN